VAEIAAASQEQSAGIEQVNKAVMQMDEMTQQNAALVEEAAAASESVDEQAQTLRQLMSFSSRRAYCARGAQCFCGSSALRATGQHCTAGVSHLPVRMGRSCAVAISAVALQNPSLV